jgi:transglutaminase-like putative cysteine protease
MSPAAPTDPATDTAAVLEVVHETRYRYSARVESAWHLAHLTPAATERQEVLSHALQIDPPPAQRVEAEDAFGNRRCIFTLDAPHEYLVVKAHSRVRLASAAAPAAAPLPQDDVPWEEVAAALRYRAGTPQSHQAQFSFASPRVPRLQALRDYAQASFPPGRPLAQAAIDLMHRLHTDMRFDTSATDVTTPVADAFAQRRGVCQDYAHAMLAALRGMGLAARYVSGYLLTHPQPGQPRLVGADASHAWISLWCPGGGWLDLDPTNDLIPAESPVVLAVGRDYGDVTPLRGVIRGGGEHQMEVGVTVSGVEHRSSA